MSNYGKKLDDNDAYMHDIFYTSLDSFKKYILFVLDKYLAYSKQTAFIYYPNGSFEDTKVDVDYNSYVKSEINMSNIGFSSLGFYYQQDDEPVYVSPEYFMVHFIERLKYAGSELYNEFEIYRQRYGEDAIDSLCFTHIHDILVDEYREKITKNKGNYYLTDDYDEKTLRIVKYLRNIELVIDSLIERIVEYFKDDFEEFDDKKYVQVYNYVEDELNTHPRKDRVVIENGIRTTYIDEKYFRLLDELEKMRERAYNDAFDRFKDDFINNTKIAASELFRLLERDFKELVATYSYRENEKRRGHKDDLGLEEIMYYAHPNDKYNPKRLTDEEIGYCAEDYDDMYVLRNKDNDSTKLERIIRTIDL